MKKLFFSLSFLMMISISLNAFEDHSEYLEGPFETGKDVTAACLECHEEQAESFMHSIHWTWMDENATVERNGKKVAIGKKTILNNFCIGVGSNEPRCTSCHAGYGWKDDSFDFSNSENIDCVVCHDQTGTYKKSPPGAGIEVKGLDLEKIAQSVGPTSNETCGSCHFYGGGGNNVKHGDLENALLTADRKLDVHMSHDGADLECTACHKTKDHAIPGTALSLGTKSSDLVQCENCHTAAPHKSKMLNKHYTAVACQTCHIPEFARVNPTKMEWDWSTAGQELDLGKDENGMPRHMKKKGSFIWDKNVVPTYAWYNGKSERMVLGDPIDFSKVNYMSEPVGDITDKTAKIFPFKIHKAKQVADKKHNYLLTTQVWKGYWEHFDWDKALKVGAEANNLPYSGEYDFVETAMYWKINHMVAPKEDALECIDCHGKKQTRIDWVALGYTEGYPRKNGGRFSQKR